MFKPGESGNVNGRPAGVANKTTNQIKQAYQKLLEDNLDNMTQWLGKIAEKDPAKATELMLKLSEYILPKLARQEVVGNDGEDLFKNVSFTFSTADKENQNGKED
jgi:hypothetical protein